MRVVLTGGGTGGHIFPALAVAELLRQAGHELLYIGKPDSMESTLVPQRGIAFEGVYFSGMPRKPRLELFPEMIQWFAQLYNAQKAAKEILNRFKPDVVFGTGGYVSGPVLLSAHIMGIPYAVHEPDAQPGLVNRLMARRARVVSAAFEESREKFMLMEGAIFEATGNPVRQDLGKMPKAEALAILSPAWTPEKKTVLIFGGSQGARRMNQATVEALPVLLEQLHLQVIHISGQKLFAETQALLAQKAPDYTHHPAYQLLPFTQEMPTLMAASDLAVTRSGSLSLSETYLAGLPTILIPYPYAAADHQTKNAQASAAAGASIVLSDSQCDGASLVNALRRVLDLSGRLENMSAAARHLAKPQASQRIVTLLTTIGQPVVG